MMTAAPARECRDGAKNQASGEKRDQSKKGSDAQADFNSRAPCLLHLQLQLHQLLIDAGSVGQQI